MGKNAEEDRQVWNVCFVCRFLGCAAGSTFGSKEYNKKSRVAHSRSEGSEVKKRGNKVPAPS